MAVKLNWTRLRSVQVSQRPDSSRPNARRRPPTAQSANVCSLRSDARLLLCRRLNRYRIKRISNLQYDQSREFRGPCSSRRVGLTMPLQYKTSQFHPSSCVSAHQPTRLSRCTRTNARMVGSG